MRKLTYFIAATLDGFIAAPDGSSDFFPLEGDHAPVGLTEYPETVPTHVRTAVGLDLPDNQRFDTVLMGRGTYELPLKEGVTSPYAHMRQYVVSTTLTSTDPAVEVIADDPVARVGELKAEGGDDAKGIWLCGGAKLARTLLPEIDELYMKMYPVAIGAGVPLFGGDFRAVAWRLASSRVFESGAVYLSYVRP